MNSVRQIIGDEERRLRRWLILQGDPDFAMHRQLKDYFLAPTTTFGTAMVVDAEDRWLAGIFFSRYNGKAFIHQYLGDYECLPDALKWLALPTQAFFRAPFVPDPTVWDNVLNVTPGYVVDHPAYNGVFSRVAPRFNGAVYETKDFR
jgi:hypothetical protein